MKKVINNKVTNNFRLIISIATFLPVMAFLGCNRSSSEELTAVDAAVNLSNCQMRCIAKLRACGNTAADEASSIEECANLCNLLTEEQLFCFENASCDALENEDPCGLQSQADGGTERDAAIGTSTDAFSTKPATFTLSTSNGSVEFNAATTCDIQGSTKNYNVTAVWPNVNRRDLNLIELRFFLTGGDVGKYNCNKASADKCHWFIVGAGYESTLDAQNNCWTHINTLQNNKLELKLDNCQLQNEKGESITVQGNLSCTP